MDLTTVQSIVCGVLPPTKPEDFPTNYINIPEKYICVYTGGYNSAKYDYYNIVLQFLKLEDIKIVQIGIQEDQLLDNVIDMRGKTNFRQTAFVIENSLLLLTNDGVWASVAGAKGIPFVILTGAFPATSVLPKYKDAYCVLEPLRGDSKPTYDQNEQPKSINNIRPEVVVEKVSTLLNLEIINFQTKKIGNLYNSRLIDYIGDCPPVQFTLPSACRMDVYYNLQNLAGYLQLNSGAIVTAAPIDIRFLTSYKSKILDIIYIVDKNVNVEWVDQLHKSGIKYTLVSYSSGADLSEIKLKLFDYNQVLERPPINITGLNSNDYFQTNRIYHGRGYPYLSLYHYKRNILPQNSINQIGDGLNDRDFQEALDNIYIYSQE